MTNLFGRSDMKRNTPFAPLALLGDRGQQRDFFAPVREQLKRQQKCIVDSPYDKLLTCFVSLLAGGCHAISQINTRIRPDTAGAKAWGVPGFAEQSTIAETLYHFTDAHVQPGRAAITRIDGRDGQALRHDYAREGLLMLDIDVTGLPASKHAEGSTTGSLSGKKGGTDGNWHACVLRRTYETLLSLLYPGNHTSVNSLRSTVKVMEQFWQIIDRHQRDHVLIRLDSGFGSDANINWLLHRGYQVLRKGYSRKRAAAFARQVRHWKQLDCGTWVAPAPTHLCCHDSRRTQTVVWRWQNHRSRRFKYALFISSLWDHDIVDVSDLYDDRAAIENAINAAKGGLLLPRRRNKHLNAPQALVLFTDLGHNILAWTRRFWATEPALGNAGM